MDTPRAIASGHRVTHRGRCARTTARSIRTALVISVATMVWGSSAAPVRINWTGSAPMGLYAIAVETPITRTDLVVVCLQGAVAGRGRARGYLAAGSCPNGVSPILKQVVATAGDEVELRSDGLAINGQVIDRSHRLVEDSLGRPLEALPLGRSVVREGEIWVLGVYRARSWDSRYFGPIPVSSVVGVARPILTLKLGKTQ